MSVLVSFAEESFRDAAGELRAVFGVAGAVKRLGPDLGVIEGDVPVVAVADACGAAKIVFVRHLTVERARIPLDRATPEAVAGAVAALGTGDPVAVQVWS